MKPSRIACVVLVLLLTPNAFAQDDTEADVSTFPLDVGASFMSRWETRHYYTPGNLDGADFVRTRARLSLSTTPTDVGDDLSALVRFVPQASGLWHVGGNSLEDPSLGLHEGVLVLNWPVVRAEVGRFEMTYGEHLVVGNVGWHETGRAFDGFRLRLSPYDEEDFWIDFFGTVLTEGFFEGPYGNPLGSGDEYFFGLYGAIGPVFGDAIQIDTYILTRVLPTSDELDRQTAAQPTVGARVKHRVGVLDYRLEAGVQFGSRPTDTVDMDNPSVFAFQGDLELGVNAADDQLRVSVEGLYASGDDPSTEDLENWDQLFPTQHKWLGFMDVIGERTNIGSGVLHLTYWPLETVRLSLDGHTFFLAETPEGIESYRGAEMDLGVLYRIGQGLHLRGGFGAFIPGDGYENDTLYFTELELAFQM